LAVKSASLEACCACCSALSTSWACHASDGGLVIGIAVLTSAQGSCLELSYLSTDPDHVDSIVSYQLGHLQRNLSNKAAIAHIIGAHINAP